LVGLNAHEADHSETTVSHNLSNEPLWFDPGVRLVNNGDVDRVATEHAPPFGVGRESVKRSKRVRRHR